jgi:hypothetical protein
MVILDSISLASLLRDLVEVRTGPPAREWLGRALEAAGGGADRGALLEAFTGAARRLGKDSLGLDPGEAARLATAGLGWPIRGWGLDELGRATLLVTAAACWPDAELEAAVEACYRQGDGRERQAVLRTLPLLPAPERFLPIAVDACRTHVQPLFEAIACENPYPACHFPELNFNQLVLKALFTGVALERIWGLDERRTPELRRMAADYASERRAAGRSIPPDIARLTGEEGPAP